MLLPALDYLRGKRHISVRSGDHWHGHLGKP